MEAILAGLHVHFLQRHAQDTMIIMEEVKLAHPRCYLCEILVPWATLNGRHLITAQYKKGAERKQRRLALEELQDIKERDFPAFGRPFTSVPPFKYLGRIVMALGDDCAVVARNLRKVQNN